MMKLSFKKLNLMLIGIFTLILVGSLLISLTAVAIMNKKSQELISLKLETELTSAQRDEFLRFKADLLKNKSYIEILERIVPDNKDQARAVAELLQIGKENNIVIGSVSFPASELGSTSNKSVGTEKITQAKAVDGISGVLGIELNISQINRVGGESGAGITYDQLIKTLQAIERNRRTMQIKNIQIQPITRSGAVIGYSPTLTINIFVKQ